MAHHNDGSSNGHSTDPLEKDHYGHGNLNNNNLTMGANDSSGDALERIRTAGSISIPPELFEKLYLSPENRVKGDLRKTFGNPTPLYVLNNCLHEPSYPTRTGVLGLTSILRALIGFLLSLTPLSCDLMGWRGAGGNGAASTGTSYASLLHDRPPSPLHD